MNEFEHDLGFEELPTDDEYLDMKAAYKQGKAYYPELPLFNVGQYSEIERTHFLNGWAYSQWLEKQE